MKILELRILPPIAIARLGSSENPLDAYSLQVPEENPLDYREIKPEPSFTIDADGYVTETTPDKITFKDASGLKATNGKVRPVCPFLEVFAVTSDDPDHLVPLTTDLLAKAGLSLNDLSWRIEVANHKMFRRTFAEDDKVTAEVVIHGNNHTRLELKGECKNFKVGKHLPMGAAQFIRPDAKHPEIRLRITPAKGHVYGASRKRVEVYGQKKVKDPLYEMIGEDFLLYKKKGSWHKYQEGPTTYPITTAPGNIFAGYEGKNEKGQDVRFSWGYLDDAFDGYVSVTLGSLTTKAHVSAGPPAYAPDTLPIRVVTDELEQILLGSDRTDEVPIEEAQEIIRRALETVRLMNTAIMNGNPYEGMKRIASTMVAQDTNDTGRMFEPIMATSIVDNLAVRSLHERVYNGIAAGATPWFESALRRPNMIGDLSDAERRKMPALMRGADGRALCLTHRQINTIIQCAANAMFKEAVARSESPTWPIRKGDLTTQLHYRGKGNPFHVLPRTAISNCFPGLEMDFRNLWRKAFVEITLIENNNLVIDSNHEYDLLHHRLVGIAVEGKEPVPTAVPTTGPTLPGYPDGNLITPGNPNGAAFMEWSNSLAFVLHKPGSTVDGYFTKEVSSDEVVFTKEDLVEADPEKLIKVKLTVNRFFVEGTAVYTDGVLEAGDLTSGLCSPWQNDYRECACYYWAASRPDYVNVATGENGLSKGDNWMAKERTGKYYPDDRTDTKFVSYQDLFLNWEGELQFIVRGNDALDSGGSGNHGTRSV
jgi:hypothetical protein